MVENDSFVCSVCFFECSGNSFAGGELTADIADDQFITFVDFVIICGIGKNERQYMSSFLIAFLPKNKCLVISWLQPPSAVILEPPKINSDTTPPYMKDVNCDINNIKCWLGEVGVGEKLKHSVFVCDSS